MDGMQRKVSIIAHNNREIEREVGLFAQTRRTIGLTGSKFDVFLLSSRSHHHLHSFSIIITTLTSEREMWKQIKLVIVDMS